MKPMQVIMITLTISFLLIGIGCQDKEPVEPTPPTPPTRAKQWESFVELKKAIGYDVLDVSESQQWITKHSDSISISDKIDFLNTHVVTEQPFITQGAFLITKDHTGKHRIVRRLHPLQKNPYGNMSETIKELKEQGYEVEKTDSGYHFKKEFTVEHTW